MIVHLSLQVSSAVVPQRIAASVLIVFFQTFRFARSLV